MAEKGYEFGVKTRLDVDDAELNLVQAQSNLAKAKRDYIVGQANLDWVMGILRFRPAVARLQPSKQFSLTQPGLTL